MSETVKEGYGKDMAEKARSEDKGVNKPKNLRVKYCYKCGGEVTEGMKECPHCGAGPAPFNPAVYIRIAIGFTIGFIIWLLLRA